MADRSNMPLNRPLQVDHIVHDMYSSIVPYAGGRLPFGWSECPTLDSVPCNVLMLADDWPAAPLFVRHADPAMPSAHVLAFRRFHAEPRGSCKPAHFPAPWLVVVGDSILAAASYVQDVFPRDYEWNGPVSPGVEIREIRQRVQRWGSMADEAVNCEFRRVRFDGVRNTMVRVLELAQTAKMLNPDHAFPAYWPQAMLRMERVCREWEERHGR